MQPHRSGMPLKSFQARGQTETNNDLRISNQEHKPLQNIVCVGFKGFVSLFHDHIQERYGGSNTESKLKLKKKEIYCTVLQFIKGSPLVFI